MLFNFSKRKRSRWHSRISNIVEVSSTNPSNLIEKTQHKPKEKKKKKKSKLKKK